MNALWNPNALAAASEGTLAGDPRPVTGISIDTRSLAPGDLFVALRGARDGHDFVGDAFAAGAAMALVEAGRARDFTRLGPVLAVDAVLPALERIGRAARARTQARIAGVTGSVGKTGTKEALRHVLSRQGATHASVASYNNHWGVPLTLARMPEGSAYGVFEMGMSAPGEILPLAAMTRPHVALVTTVEAVHIEAFPSVEAIADEKAAIYGGLVPGGTAIVNRDNPHAARLLAHAMAGPAGRVITFGRHEAADIRALDITLSADGSDIDASFFGRRARFAVGSPGLHTALNALGVLATVFALGADIDEAAHALLDLAPPEGRGARRLVRLPKGGSLTLIDEAYNANPASLRAALANLAAIAKPPGARKIAILGDMLELGPRSAEWHRDMADPIEAADVDLVFCSGREMAHLFEAMPAARRGAHRPSADELAPVALEALRDGDIVMVKGSKGSLVSRIVTAIKALDPGS